MAALQQRIDAGPGTRAHSCRRRCCAAASGAAISRSTALHAGRGLARPRGLEQRLQAGEHRPLRSSAAHGVVEMGVSVTGKASMSARCCVSASSKAGWKCPARTVGERGSPCGDSTLHRGLLVASGMVRFLGEETRRSEGALFPHSPRKAGAFTCEPSLASLDVREIVFQVAAPVAGLGHMPHARHSKASTCVLNAAHAPGRLDRSVVRSRAGHVGFEASLLLRASAPRSSFSTMVPPRGGARGWPARSASSCSRSFQRAVVLAWMFAAASRRPAAAHAHDGPLACRAERGSRWVGQRAVHAAQHKTGRGSGRKPRAREAGDSQDMSDLEGGCAR